MHYHVEANALIRIVKGFTRHIRDSVYIRCHRKLCHFVGCYRDLRFSTST